MAGQTMYFICKEWKYSQFQCAIHTSVTAVYCITDYAALTRRCSRSGGGGGKSGSWGWKASLTLATAPRILYPESKKLFCKPEQKSHYQFKSLSLELKHYPKKLFLQHTVTSTLISVKKRCLKTTKLFAVDLHISNVSVICNMHKIKLQLSKSQSIAKVIPKRSFRIK